MEKIEDIKDKVAKSYRWRDFDHFERNADYIDGDFIKAVNDVINLEKEVQELRAQVELKLFSRRKLESDNKELREFKEKVNKELRLWHLEACDRDSSEKALNNIEDMILEGE